MRLVLINEHAAHVRRKPGLLADVQRLCQDGWAEVRVSTSSDEAVAMLNVLVSGSRLTEIFVLGGDGTFRIILDWVLGLPARKRPALTPIGGGQFCYVARFAGYANTPLENLKKIRAEGDRRKRCLWQPLRIENMTTETYTHAALLADGVVAQFVELYVENGKGGLFATVWQILSVIVRAILGDTGAFRHAHGEMHADAREIPSPRAASVLSAIPSPMPYSRPFHGQCRMDEFHLLVWWNTLPRLAAAVPFIWFGSMSPWGRNTSLNTPVRMVTLVHNSECLSLDGDPYPVARGDKLRVVSGDAVFIYVF